ncbi:hypothetical protein TRAPUB_6121 [Trametes pubescens]|uniref:Uncharacterized protein n=1 Tax=Trametes pubescens TaxID=154538 RepID=A0A1M2V6Y1_TRAPU|nr:hypothetical protein TRAPUB_6121 [Trametes pubescens]
MSDDVPSWPSLYNIVVELFPLQHRDPTQEIGRYLHDPHDVFRFTLYWTLIFYTPLYILCGIYAFLNLAFPPFHAPLKSRKPKAIRADSGPSYRSVAGRDDIPMRRYDRQLGPDTQSQAPAPSRSRAKQNETRSRLTFALLVLFVFAVAALAGAVVGSAIIGYVMAGLFKASKYNMSTYPPRETSPTAD